ncbi:hypothetical protein KIL84_011959 [Mauremys mutica]|uniref:Uncharacterized protein n=1 Tax=Mauremys mutica TaxID=74926 RepID=A0A9D4AVU6_9SAUR|nr:hypothetical protein KIL84_011959 [Mauremys mutica]
MLLLEACWVPCCCCDRSSLSEPQEMLCRAGTEMPSVTSARTCSASQTPAPNSLNANTSEPQAERMPQGGWKNRHQDKRLQQENLRTQNPASCQQICAAPFRAHSSKRQP